MSAEILQFFERADTYDEGVGERLTVLARETDDPLVTAHGSEGRLRQAETVPESALESAVNG